MNRKEYIMISIIIIFIGCLYGLYYFFIKTTTINLTTMPVTDIQEQIEVHKELGYCSEGYVAENGAGAVFEVTKWQKRKWLDTLYNELDSYVARINELEHMRIYISNDMREMIVHADREVSFQTLATYLGAIVWNIEIIQALNDNSDWKIEFTAKDIETEKVLYQADFPAENIKLDESLWDEIEK